MKQQSFQKGIHPLDKKELAKDQQNMIMPLPQQVVIPLHQHIGAPAEVLVKKGDRVLKGQKIGAAKSLISAPVHASVAGTVIAVEPRLSPLGGDVLSVVITNDGSEEPSPEMQPLHADLSAYSPDDVRKIVRETGIVGLGGAAFPTAVKLAPPKEYPLDSIILNGAECEPYLTTDYRLMLEKTEQIIAAGEIVKNTVGAGHVFIAIEANKADAIESFEKKLRGRSDFSVVSLKTKYPQGGEKMLVKAVLNRRVPNGGLPFHVGVIVQNVATTFAIYEALVSGKPLYERFLTVSGEGVLRKQNLQVRIGTSFKDIIEYCGGYSGQTAKLIMGGPMMGISQWSDDVPVIKATSGILALGEPVRKTSREYPCIRCNACTSHCPMFLVPTRIVNYIKIKNYAAAQRWGVADCMECGTCAFACPAEIPLVQWIRLGKFEVMHLNKMEAKQ